MLKELCVENFTLVPKGIKNGANRLELCDNLAVGGTTVSIGVLEATLAYAQEENVSVFAIIRPRGGNFVYNDTELKIMGTDILEFKKSGVDGIVLGCLTDQQELDKDALEDLLELCEGLEVTFHMAFDHIKKEKQLESLTWLFEHGVTRVLTHGGPLDTPIEENLPYLKELMEKSPLTILPGGGITFENAEKISQALNAKELHGTKIVPLI